MPDSFAFKFNQLFQRLTFLIMSFEKGVLSDRWSNSLNELQNANPFLQSALLCLYKALKTPLIINLVNNKSN
jgi:hypothetical protein